MKRCILVPRIRAQVRLPEHDHLVETFPSDGRTLT